MAQLVVRKLDERIKLRLRERAKARGVSMEQEVRDILQAVLAAVPESTEKPGTRMARHFTGIGLEHEIEEWRGQSARPADFES
jgi:antitoxin FitA